MLFSYYHLNILEFLPRLLYSPEFCREASRNFILQLHKIQYQNMDSVNDWQRNVLRKFLTSSSINFLMNPFPNPSYFTKVFSRYYCIALLILEAKVFPGFQQISFEDSLARYISKHFLGNLWIIWGFEVELPEKNSDAIRDVFWKYFWRTNIDNCNIFLGKLFERIHRGISSTTFSKIAQYQINNVWKNSEENFWIFGLVILFSWIREHIFRNPFLV